MVTLARLEHSLKADSPMLITLVGIVMLVRLEHKQKAKSPMLITLVGMVMLVRLVHLKKAPSAMLIKVLPERSRLKYLFLLLSLITFVGVLFTFTLTK